MEGGEVVENPPIDTIIQGDALTVLKTFPDEFINCCVTSPPYWGLRDYGVDGQLGLEKTPEEYVGKMVEVFREVNRVLKKEGEEGGKTKESNG
jgi:DNA modification methylase